MQKKLENVTFVPLKLYLSKGKVKMLMGVCCGKKLHDKRETIKKRELERNIREC
jgi:SsrA-binding protein